MIYKRIVANLVVFASISVFLVTYGFLTLFGNPWAHPRTLHTDLPDAGGLRPGFSASFDGVVVGTVSDVELRSGHVRVTVELDDGVVVPRGVEARVVRASAVGEQRLDLSSIPGGSQEPLDSGAEVAAADDPIPPDVADVLDTANDLIRALPAEDLNTVVHEAALGIDGRAEDIRTITDSLVVLSDRAVSSEDDIRRLLDHAPAVLDDFAAMSPAVHDALGDTEALTSMLAERREDLVDLMSNAADLATVGDEVLLENRANLTCLIGDLGGIVDNLQGQTLADLDRALLINQQFFGLISDVAVSGPAIDLGTGAGVHEQLWLRTRLLVPPQTPAASAYRPPRAPRPVTVGDSCESVYGPGAPATPAPTTAQTAALRRASPTDPYRRDGPAAVAQATPIRALGQAPEPPSSNPPTIPLIVLGAGVLAALASLVPLVRTHRRSR